MKFFLFFFYRNMNTSNIGSDIVSFSLLEGHNTENLDPPVQIQFKHLNVSHNKSIRELYKLNRAKIFMKNCLKTFFSTSTLLL